MMRGTPGARHHAPGSGRSPVCASLKNRSAQGWKGGLSDKSWRPQAGTQPPSALKVGVRLGGRLLSVRSNDARDCKNSVKAPTASADASRVV
jgi:hypothetical protein